MSTTDQQVGITEVSVVPRKGALIRIPTEREIGGVSEFDQFSYGREEDLLLLDTKIEAKSTPFYRLISGNAGIRESRPYVIGDSTLIDVFQQMRDASMIADIEYDNSIYQSQHDGSYLALRNPPFGGYNSLDHYYFSGPIVVIDGYERIASIHSHPPGRRFYLDTQEARAVQSHTPSTWDVGNLLLNTTGHNGQLVNAEVVIGQGLVHLIARTKDSTPRSPRENFGWVGVQNAILGLERDVSERYHDLSKMTQKMLTIYQACAGENLAWYLMRLRQTGDRGGDWVRFNPWPINIDEALNVLLG